MMLYANLAGPFEVTASSCMAVTALPAPVSLFDLHHNLVRCEFLEVVTGAEVVILIIKMWAIKL